MGCVLSGCRTCDPIPRIPPLIEIAGTYLRFDAVPTWFVVWRCVVMVVQLYIVIFSLALRASKGEFGWWFIYLTSWTAFTLAVAAMVRLVSTVQIRPFGARKLSYASVSMLFYRFCFPLQSSFTVSLFAT